jgi:uncharacterized protein involved in oxidation of intracellular sulfur
MMIELRSAKSGAIMKTLLILNDPPYGTERSYNALRLAIALQKNDPAHEVAVFLMADAVACARAGQKTPEGFYNLERMLKRVTAAGGRLLLCGTCMDARGLGEAELVTGANRSTMDELAAETIAADKVLVF